MRRTDFRRTFFWRRLKSFFSVVLLSLLHAPLHDPPDRGKNSWPGGRTNPNGQRFLEKEAQEPNLLTGAPNVFLRKRGAQRFLEKEAQEPNLLTGAPNVFLRKRPRSPIKKKDGMRGAQRFLEKWLENRQVSHK